MLPTHNAARWFEEAIASVATDGCAEILVIDDGSEPSQRDIVEQRCRSYSNVRFFPQPHRGLVHTLNFGLSIATASYIGRMDADDVSLPGRFSAQAAFLDQHPEAVLVGTQIQYMDEAGVPFKRSSYPQEHPDIYRALLSGRNLIQHPSVLMRRQAVIHAGGYDPSMECAEDYDLWLRLGQLGELRNLPEVFLHYRRHATQISTIGNLKQKHSRDAALLRAHLASLPSANGDMANHMALIQHALAPVYAVVEKALAHELLTSQDLSTLGNALHLRLVGEDTVFKRHLIKSIQTERLAGNMLKSLIASAYLNRKHRSGRAAYDDLTAFVNADA